MMNKCTLFLIAVFFVASAAAGIQFDGESFTSVRVRIPKNATSPSRTLPEFLRCARCSDVPLLDTDDVIKRPDGLWHANQKSVGWFGLELVPVFVYNIIREKRENRLTAAIVEARTDIRGGGGGTRGITKILQEGMEKSQISAQNILSWEEVRDNNTDEGSDDRVWTLSGELSMTLTINLPPYVPLPPGFNSIGSRIISSTCKKRANESLLALIKAYEEWACLP